MACRYFSFFHSYLFLILVFHNSLEGQNQFGRIFKENANPLFRDNIKQDTVVKQKDLFMISEQQQQQKMEEEEREFILIVCWKVNFFHG